MTSPDLAELIARSAAGDRAAFAALHRATRAKLFAVAMRILRRSDLAEDIVQDAYVRIWRSAASYNSDAGSPIAWMAAIVRNRAIDEVRRKPDASLDAMPDSMEIADEPVDPLAAREASEALRKLMACLDGLEPERRGMVLLAYHRGLSREALAEKFGAPVNTIKTWLRRSLLQLRECMG